MPVSSRRTFLLGSAATAAGALLHADETSQTLRIGLIGCGSRGTGAAEQALSAAANVKLVAMDDAFEDRLPSSHNFLSKSEKVGARVDVPADNRFVGFDAYKQ